MSDSVYPSTTSDIDGYWRNANGDNVQLFNNDIFVLRRDGTVINGPATVVRVDDGHSSVTYQSHNGSYVSGYLSRDANRLVFGADDVFERQNYFGDGGDLSPSGAESNILRIFFQEDFMTHVEDAFR